MTLYRLLLRLFPRTFRERFGDDMAEVFADRAAEARRAGPLTALRWWARTIADAVRHGVAERRVAANRRTRGNGLMRGLVQDVRFALRLFNRQRGFTATAVATLALGIGVNVAIFSVVDGVLLRKPSLPDPDRVVEVSGAQRTMPTLAYLSLRDRATAVFSALAATGFPQPAALTGAGPARIVTTVDTTPEISV